MEKNERNYTFTLGEMLDKFASAVEPLRGKNPKKEPGGISAMVDKAVAGTGLDLIFYNVYVKDCRIYIDTVDFGNVEIAHFITKYKPDARKYTGIGDYLESVTINMCRDIPRDTAVLDLMQILSYDVARERKERVEKEVEELKKELEERNTYIVQMEEIMKKQSYSNQ